MLDFVDRFNCNKQLHKKIPLNRLVSAEVMFTTKSFQFQTSRSLQTNGPHCLMKTSLRESPRARGLVFLGGGGGGGKGARACREVSEIYMFPWEKSAKNADWWKFKLLMIILFFACIMI